MVTEAPTCIGQFNDPHAMLASSATAISDLGVDPADVVAARATTELFFTAALTALNPRQRAVLIVTELLGWSATEAATLIDASVPATKSLLQRARHTSSSLAFGDAAWW